jgi:hypothetical protein
MQIFALHICKIIFTFNTPLNKKFMKNFLLPALFLFSYSHSISQSKITITVNGKHDDIFGYAMNPDGSDIKSISIFGGMQNLTSVLQMSYMGGTAIPSVIISETGATAADSVIIRLTNVTVYGLKQYASDYTNGSFTLSSSGNVNTEIRCRFQSMHIQQSSGSQQIHVIDPGKIAINNMASQKWEMQTDASVTGLGGKVTLQLPDGTSYHTHLEFYDVADNKTRVASWFGNNENNLLPGSYNVVVDGKYTIRNVPVEKGKTTRLKMGIFSVDNYGGVQIENSDHEKFSYSGPFSILLPEGTYFINGRKDHPVFIKDGTVTKL